MATPGPLCKFLEGGQQESWTQQLGFLSRGLRATSQGPSCQLPMAMAIATFKRREHRFPQRQKAIVTDFSGTWEDLP